MFSSVLTFYAAQIYYLKNVYIMSIKLNTPYNIGINIQPPSCIYSSSHTTTTPVSSYPIIIILIHDYIKNAYQQKQGIVITYIL